MKWLHVLSAFLLLLFNHHASATNVVDSISDSLSTQHLGEVLVLAKSVYRENNHINILPSNRQKRHSDTGYALLRNLMIPGIDIEDDGVIKAKGSVAGVYINGQPAEVRDIQNIHPVDVVRIEYYDMPDGKYSKDVSAINFVLRQYKSGGYVQLSGEQAVNINKGSYNITSSVSKGKNAYSFLQVMNIIQSMIIHSKQMRNIISLTFRLTGIHLLCNKIRNVPVMPNFSFLTKPIRAIGSVSSPLSASRIRGI